MWSASVRAADLLIRLGVMRPIRRMWYRLSYRRAQSKLRSLAASTNGLLEQVREGTVNLNARSALASELDAI